MRVKIILPIIFMLLLCTLTCLASNSEERASLFIGDDEWSDDSLMPFIETEGKKLIPAVAFEKLDGISVKASDVLGSLLISNGEKYISYNLNFGTCINEDGIISKADIYSYGGALYLEPTPICQKFSLTFETEYAPDGYLAARITDGSELMSFKELLAMYASSSESDLPFLYNPTGKTVAGLFMYPYILLPSIDNVKAVLPLLQNHSVTFAILPQNIASYASVIPEIYASGHTIAYYMDEIAASDIESFRTVLEEANAFLFAFTGKSSHIYISTDLYGNIPKINGYFAKSCRTNLVAADLVDERIVNIALMNSPAAGSYNFSLASDSQTRANYRTFFRKFSSLQELKAMSATEAGPIK